MAISISTVPNGSAASSTDNALLQSSPPVTNISPGLLLVALVAVTGQTTGTFTATWGGSTLTFTLAGSALKNNSADALLVFVSDTLTPSGMSSVTLKFTPAGSPTNTGAILGVHSVSGMTRTGSYAVRQIAKQENSVGGTPSVTFASSVNTNNATIGGLAKGDTSPISPPGSWTEGFDLNYSTPNTSLETVYRNSGFSGTNVQWLAQSNFCALMAELDISAPTVTSVAASSGPTAGGTNVTITGTGFFGAPTVTFGGSAATNVTVTSATTITCTTPAHADGAVNVVVTNPDTQTGTGTNAFTFVAAPTVASVSASTGSTVGGTDVTVTGTGFSATPTITFGGSAATNVVFTNSTTLTCTTPAHSAGAVDVVVTNPDTQTGTGAGAFTYVAPSTAGPPLVAGCPKVDLSIRSFTVGQPGGFF